MTSQRHTLLVRTLVAVYSLASIGMLAGCDSRTAPFALSDIGGLMPNLELQMNDENGRKVAASDYLGRVVLLYFGYTHCPDACPTTLSTLSRAIAELGHAGVKARVLFVTVDPKRDTTAVLQRYVSAFGPQFTGLRGDDAELSRLARRYRVAYRLEPPDADGDYAVDHSSAVFIFDAEGRARLLAHAEDTPEMIAADLARLIDQRQRDRDPAFANRS
jgi:protein SCO1